MIKIIENTTEKGIVNSELKRKHVNKFNKRCLNNFMDEPND